MIKKRYTLKTYFNFGKYRGCTLEEVLMRDPTYVYWAVKNIPEFYIPLEEIPEKLSVNCKNLEDGSVSKIEIPFDEEVKSILYDKNKKFGEIECFYVDEAIISLENPGDSKNGIDNNANASLNNQNIVDYCTLYEEYRERTFDHYEGYYVQDVLGWSDQEIDDAFDGEADAYWNID